MTLTAKQTAQKFILNLYGKWQADERLQGDLTAEQIAAYWEEFADDLQDARNEARYHGQEVPFKQVRDRAHYSWGRHYDVCVRVINLDGETGLAYNFMSGGGKHGEPDSYPWWDEAWFVKCTGTETVVTHTYEDIPEPEKQAETA